MLVAQVQAEGLVISDQRGKRSFLRGGQTGSLVGQAAPGSDVDIVVGFDGSATSKRYFGVQFYLEDALGCPVDLVTEKAMRPELRRYIEQEALNV